MDAVAQPDRQAQRRAGLAARWLLAALPLAAIGLFLPIPVPAPPAPWPSAAAWIAAAMAAASTIGTVADALRRGRTGRFADAAAFGALTVTAAALALRGALLPGLLVGAAFISPLLVIGSFANRLRLEPGLARGAAAVGAFLAIEACLGAVLLAEPAGTAGSASTLEPWQLAVTVGAALLLALAALASLDRPPRATWLAFAASGAVAPALLPPASPGPTLALISMSVAALGVALSARAETNGYARPRLPAAPATTAPAMPILGEPGLDAEMDAGRRLTRELRATIEELSAARRTVQLQRAEIERLASVDPLTGVAPRPAILERLRIEANEAHRYAHPFALALIDVDGLAEINRRDGREVGDQVLREVALRLRLRTRQADALGRVDGDAFLAVMPHTDERGATVFSDAVRRVAAERPIATDIGELHVTVSIGVAIMRPELTLTDDELLGVVTEALASAKAGGGNRIAFDRLHGLARIEDRPMPADPAPDASAPDTPAAAPPEGADSTT